jgi:hypothetical protein
MDGTRPTMSASMSSMQSPHINIEDGTLPECSSMPPGFHSPPPSHIICRLRPYIRLDLSATFNIRKTEKYENGINLSIVNALARENDIMYKLKVYPEEGFSDMDVSHLC